MSTGWENNDPAPIEFLHGRLLELFHEYRLRKTESMNVEINGGELNNIIARAKTLTYEKYEHLNLRQPIPKNGES